MGTFHDTNDPLHGVTVVARCGDTVYVGRCHERNDQRILLLDADQHQDGHEGQSLTDYLANAARFGVWAQHKRLEVPVAGIEALAPLSDYYRNTDSAPANGGHNASLSPLAQPAQPAHESASPASPVRSVAALQPELLPETPPEVMDAQPVTLTETARTEIRRLLEDPDNEAQGLRLGVAGGGCSGLVYKVEFDARRSNDIVMSTDDFDVFLDPKSAIYLRGVTLDFAGGLGGRGFQFRNPNATNTCGCGESFAV